MADFNPYEVPSAPVADMAGPEPLELAGRGARLGAKFLDAFIGAGGIGIIAAIAIPVMLAQRDRPGSIWMAAGFGLLLVAAVLALLIVNLLWLHRYGQTIGKRILGIQILRSSGEQAELGRLVGLRFLLVWLIGAVPLLGPIFSLVNVCFIFRDDRRCIHDLMADTIVVRVRA